MLRTLFVIIITLVGIAASFYGTFNALMFYLWMAYFRPEDWLWNNFFSSLNLSLYVGVFLLLSTFFTHVKLKFTLFAGLLTLVAIHSLTSSLLSNYSSVSFSYWIDFIKIVVISYLITMVIRSEKDLKVTLIIISLSLGLEGAKQGWLQLILNPGATNANTHLMLGDNNGVAVGMIMLVPVLFALYQTTERKLFKYGFGFLAIGIIYRALSTYSRGGFLTFLVMCIIFWLRSKHKFRILIIVALISALLLPVFPQEFWDRMDTITVGEDEKRDDSAAGRLYYWQVAMDMAKSEPIFGVGHNAYRQAYGSFSGGQHGTRRSVHSAWFGILSEWGFLGFAFYMGIYIYSLFSCTKVRRMCKNKPELKNFLVYGISLETSLIAAAVGITFLSFQYIEILWHFFALAVVTNQIVRAQYEAQGNTLIKSADENTDLFGTEISMREVKF